MSAAAKLHENVSKISVAVKRIVRRKIKISIRNKWELNKCGVCECDAITIGIYAQRKTLFSISCSGNFHLTENRPLCW